MKRTWAVLLVMGLLVVGCDGGTGEETTVPTTVAPASTMAVTTTDAPTTAETPATTTSAPSVWDVVALGDSYIAGTGVGGPQQGLAGAYARLLSEQLGIETDLHAYTNYETVADWSQGLAGSEAMQDQIAAAEVVIVWLGYHNVLWDLWGETCGTDWPEPLRTCLIEATATMPADYDALLGTIEGLVSDEAIVMIGNQALGPPEIERWGNEPFWPELKAVAYDGWAAGIASAAAAHGAILVDSARWLSGPEGNRLLRREYLQPDGLHFTREGYEALAKLFLAADGLGE